MLVVPGFQELYYLTMIHIEQCTQDIYFRNRNKRLNLYTNKRKCFDQPVKNEIRTYEIIAKIATGQGDDYATGCLRDYTYFKESNKLNLRDLSKQ